MRTGERGRHAGWGGGQLDSALGKCCRDHFHRLRIVRVQGREHLDKTRVCWMGPGAVYMGLSICIPDVVGERRRTAEPGSSYPRLVVELWGKRSTHLMLPPVMGKPPDGGMCAGNGE